MTDRLEHALRALREGQTGVNPRSEATLDRVLVSRRGTAASWGKRARLFLPIAAVLVVATTALARSGALHRIRALVAGETGLTGAVAAPAPPALSIPARESPPPAELPSAEPSAPDTPPLPAPGPARALVATHAPTSPTRAPAQAPSAAPVSSTTQLSLPPSPAPPSPAAASEADAYARAHKVHFDGSDPSAALAEWDDYLTRYPGGRFAPDARFNRAIDLLKLKRYAEARAALVPFADGEFGGYHGADARELLRSIP